MIFDLDAGSDENGFEPGQVVPFDDAFSDVLPDLLAGNAIDPIISDDTYGWLLTIYTPVKNLTGETVCYACTDISMNRLRANEYAFFARLISLFLQVFSRMYSTISSGTWSSDVTPPSGASPPSTSRTTANRHAMTASAA